MPTFEQLSISTTAIALTPAKYTDAGRNRAEQAVVTVEGASIRVRMDGTDPTSSVGHIISSAIVLTSNEEIRNFRAIRDSIDTIINVSYFTDSVTQQPAPSINEGSSDINATQLQGRDVSASAPSSTEVLTWNGSAWAPAAGGTPAAPPQFVTVETANGDYTTIAAAIAAITDAAANKPYVVKVGVGVFTEVPITVKSYVSIQGRGVSTIVIASNNNSHLFNMSDDSLVDNCTITGPTNASAIYATGGVTNVSVHRLNFLTALRAIHAHTAGTQIVAQECRMYPPVIRAHYTASDGRINCSNQLSYAENFCHANSGTIWVHNSGSEGATHGLRCQAGGIIKPMGISLIDCQTAAIYLIDSGSKILEGQGRIEASIGDDIYMNNAGAHVDWNGSYDSTKLNISAGSYHLSGLDTHENSYRTTVKQIIEEKLIVGTPLEEQSVHLGDGGWYTVDNQGNELLRMYAYDESAASDSRFTKWAGLAGTMLDDTDDALYIGGQIHFWALMADISTAKSATNNLVPEYWNGSAWVDLTVMCVSETLGAPSRNDYIFETVEEQILMWSNSINGAWTADDDVVDEIPDEGSDLYWIRLRNPAAIGTPAILDELRIRGNGWESCDPVGASLLFGNYRKAVEDLLPQGTAFNAGGNNPINGDISISPNITLEGKKNKFEDGALNELKFQWQIPLDCDLSEPLHFKIQWYTPVTTGNVEWFVFYAFTTNTSVMDGSLPEVSTTDVVTAPGVANTLENTEFTIDISARTPGDFINISFGRDAQGSNDPPDTLVGDVTITLVGMRYCTWKV